MHARNIKIYQRTWIVLGEEDWRRVRNSENASGDPRIS